MNYVSWEATLYIWWAIFWRTLLGWRTVDIIEYFLISTVAGASKAIDEHFVLCRLLDAVLSWWVMIWAIQASLMDRYTTFSLVAEQRATGYSIFNVNRRLGFPEVVSVWWAQTAPQFIAGLAVVVGVAAAAHFSHKDVEGALTSLNESPALGYYFVIMFVISIWATRESVADRYRSFRLRTQPRMIMP